MRFWAAAMIAGLAISSAANASAYGEYPIYGTHFYGTGEESSIKNGKGMWSVETLYTQRYANPSAEKSKIQNIVNKGFRVNLIS